MKQETIRLFKIIDDFNAAAEEDHQTGFCIAPTHQIQATSEVETFEAWVKIVHELNETKNY